jgi:hypothetical protein
MMKAILANHKFHLGAIGIILSIFILSLVVRQKELNAELSAQQEWITAHVLLTNQIWEEGGGPSNFGFNPVYSYEGKGNKAIPSLGGLKDEKGDMYYVSYPPLAFIFSYYGTQLLGGSNVHSIRALGLILHFFCAFFIYLIFKNLSTKKNDRIHYSGLFAAALYLLSAGTLWMHSTLFFSDMLVQPFIILSLLYAIKIYQSKEGKSRGLIVSLGLLTFLACYTEWLSVFLAFFLGITFLLLFFILKRKSFLTSFFVISASSILSVITTILQYSSIAGFDKFLQVSTHKYEQRSGYEDEVVSAAGFNVENPDAYRLLFQNINQNFLTATILMGLLAAIFIVFLIFKKQWEKMENLSSKIGIIVLLLFAILMHYLVFFNFNALHNFSNLKTGFLIIMTCGLLLSIMEDALKGVFQWILYLGVTILFIIKIPAEARRFHVFSEEPYFVHHLKYSALQVKALSDEETIVFSDVRVVSPEYMLRSHHNVFALQDSSQVPFFMDYFEVDKADFYKHDKVVLEKMYHFERQGDEFIITSTFSFEPSAQ